MSKFLVYILAATQGNILGILSINIVTIIVTNELKKKPIDKKPANHNDSSSPYPSMHQSIYYHRFPC